MTATLSCEAMQLVSIPAETLADEIWSVSVVCVVVDVDAISGAVGIDVASSALVVGGTDRVAVVPGAVVVGGTDRVAVVPGALVVGGTDRVGVVPGAVVAGGAE